MNTPDTESRKHEIAARLVELAREESQLLIDRLLNLAEMTWTQYMELTCRQSETSSTKRIRAGGDDEELASLVGIEEVILSIRHCSLSRSCDTGKSNN